MDYCYSCRRTLNGALVCPGCGAYAPDIAPPASAYMGNTAAAPAAWDAFGAAPSGHPGASAGPLPTMQNMQVPGYAAPGEHAYAAPYAEPGLPGGAHPAAGHGYAGRDAVRIEPARPRPATPRRLPAELTEEDGDLPGGELPGGDVPSVLGPPSLAPTLHRGRAARRRQLARWKKNRRRAGVATAFALFGGGVTVASMQGHSGKDGATTAAADPQTPTALQTDNTSASSPSTQAAPSAAPKHAAPQHHSTAAQPAPRASQAGPDSITSIPASVIPSGRTVTYSAASKPAPSTTTAPTAPSSSTQTASTTSSSSNSGSSSGSTATTPPATPPASTPPATTAPSTPPPQQLCLLIVCLG
ncbi:hypothetical protein SAMN05216267_1009167 [Actinacidiphila rubida]|uniref:Uncharacterized protein n=1 Tax=Actinacidiphila rubida TaxID=310780 RepID=A0A1H8J4T1_9ACTN|nr:hypothetical protein [Actinacidiphila rubida]SEN75601.1 hypothetical protein SAMN05216267_1009167 [Actinacidiphila rubida]